MSVYEPPSDCVIVARAPHRWALRWQQHPDRVPLHRRAFARTRRLALRIRIAGAVRPDGGGAGDQDAITLPEGAAEPASKGQRRAAGKKEG